MLSAQPVEDPRSPRFFVFLGPLIVTVLPEGATSSLLEIGQLVSGQDSVKAEVAFPLLDTLAPDAPFARVLDETHAGTKCGTCHGNEHAAPDIAPLAFTSDAVKPRADALLRLQVARDLHESCDEEEAPERCAIFSALFDHGEVVETSFPDTLKSLF